MSNQALIAPKFVASGPTTLIMKEKKGLSLSGTSLQSFTHQLLASVAAERSSNANCLSRISTLPTHRIMLCTGDSGKILDVNGTLMFKIDANLMTISERRTLEDASGEKIGTVRVKKTPGLHKTYYLGTMADDKKCAVKAKG
jgi:hypothetical protein